MSDLLLLLIVADGENDSIREKNSFSESQKTAIFEPIFERFGKTIRKNWSISAHFFQHFFKSYFFKAENWAKNRVLPKKSGFLPIYFSKVGRLKPLRHKGLRVFRPLSHFFFTLL